MPVGPVVNVCCPSCNSIDVALQPVSLHVQPRNYAESPHTRAMLAEVEQRNRQTSLPGTAAASADAGECSGPVRQTSFVLQRKILSFESVVDEGEEREQEQEQEQQQADNLAEPSVSRTAHAAAAGLPPRRPLATHVSASQPVPRAALRDVSNLQPAVAVSDKLAVQAAVAAAPHADAPVPAVVALDSLPSIVPFSAHASALPIAPAGPQPSVVAEPIDGHIDDEAALPLQPLLDSSPLDLPIFA